YVRFDLNDYSVPHTNVHRVLTVLADLHEVRVVDGGAVLAGHPRSYDRGAQIEHPSHVAALVEQKRAARQHRATDRLAQAAPASQTLLIRAAERGANLGAITAALMRLLAQTSAAEMQAAILEALQRNVGVVHFRPFWGNKRAHGSGRPLRAGSRSTGLLCGGGGQPPRFRRAGSEAVRGPAVSGGENPRLNGAYQSPRSDLEPSSARRSAGAVINRAAARPTNWR